VVDGYVVVCAGDVAPAGDVDANREGGGRGSVVREGGGGSDGWVC